MFKKFLGTGFIVFAMACLSNCSMTDVPTTTTTTPSGSTSTNCSSTPSYNAGLTDSTASSVSHRFGENCMSCHAAGQSQAQTYWTVAGSMANGNNSTTKAAAGSVITNIGSGNVTLTVDTCGNFYTTSTAYGVLDGSLPATTSGGTMGGGSWHNNAQDGSCNQSTCHWATGGIPGLIY